MSSDNRAAVPVHLVQMTGKDDTYPHLVSVVLIHPLEHPSDKHSP